MDHCPHGRLPKACEPCRQSRLLAWGVKAPPPADRPEQIADMVAPEILRPERVPGERRIPFRPMTPPPQGKRGKRTWKAERRAAAQHAWREMSGEPEPSPTGTDPERNDSLGDREGIVAEPVQPSSTGQHRKPATDATVVRPWVGPTPAEHRGARRAREAAALSATSTGQITIARAAAAAIARAALRPWSREGLTGSTTEGWFDRDDIALFTYMDSRNLVLDFKDGHPQAVTEVSAWFRGTLSNVESELRRRGFGYVVAAPRHIPGPAPESAERLCTELASAFPWLTHIAGALRRTAGVTSGYHDHRRPSLEDHVRTIAYHGPHLAAAGRFGILLIDDVFTTGSTSRACRRVLMEATGASDVIGMFISKTSARRAYGKGIVKPEGAFGRAGE